ncbi:MAG: CBS domain-containing protein [Methanomicrobiaceae archaeon]|nr:CBS domain-containing protein [Methanomicrobiaceae archaeon]
MAGSFQIGTLFGIPVRLHWTFLIVIPLFAYIIGVQIGPTTELLAGLFGVEMPNMELIASGIMPYVLGVVVALGLFLGVFIHELAHSLIAKAKGIKINSITLLILGGISSMEEQIPDPVVELPMALAGPLTSLALGLACTAVALVLNAATPLGGLIFFIFGYLGLLNIILFGFNLLPAFPMDGGRVLRAWLAKRMPLHRATRIAADVGKAFAIIFGIVGFVLFNFILIIIAFFIYIGAGQESQALKYTLLLQDVTVEDAMSKPVVTVPPDLPVKEVISMMQSSRHLGFPVVRDRELVGIVTLSDVHAIPEGDRETIKVEEIMTRDVVTLPPAAPLTEALKLISVRDFGRIPVVEKGEIRGIVTRSDILRVMELKEA